MKRILVPIDFSDTSIHAATYAAELARLSGASLILFHAYSMPVPATEVPELYINFEDVERGVREGMEHEAKRLRNAYGLQVEINYKIGFPVEEITEFIKQHQPDLTVMGIPQLDKVSQFLIGSTTTGVIKKTNFPVWVVPADYHFKPVHKLVIARENSMISQPNLQLLKTIIDLFKADLHVLEVIQPHQMEPGMIEEVKKKSLEGLEHFNPKLRLLVRDDIEKVIEEYIDDEKMDMIVMLPKHHHLFERIFEGSFTRKMVFHTHIPLLALHVD